jgi:hypothetical protein
MRPRRFPDLSPRRRAITFAVIGLLAPFMVGTVSSAHAGDIAPTGLNVVATTPNTGLGGAVPSVLVQAGGSFTLTVSLSPSGATFKKDTPVDLTPTLMGVSDSPHGTFSPSRITFPAGVPSASFAVSYSAADNSVVLNATVDSPNEKVAAGSTEPFDVVSTLLLLAHDNPQLATGVGVGDSSCSQATTEPECGIIVLPNGIESPKAAFTLGRCTPTLLRCTNGSQVIQFVADLGTRYSPTNPATLIVRCDKQLCRSTNNGIRAFTLKVSQSASGPLDHVSQPCAAKGVADNGLNNGDTFCTDYVQSHRDNSGDLLLYLLFTQDMRGST